MEMYNWESLGTFAGASAATLLVVQYLKLPLDKVCKIHTRILVLIVAALILLAGQAMSPAGISLRDIPLIVVNSFLVALSAMGAYENTFKSSDRAQ